MKEKNACEPFEITENKFVKGVAKYLSIRAVHELHVRSRNCRDCV